VLCTNRFFGVTSLKVKTPVRFELLISTECSVSRGSREGAVCRICACRDAGAFNCDEHQGGQKAIFMGGKGGTCVIDVAVSIINILLQQTVFVLQNITLYNTAPSITQ